MNSGFGNFITRFSELDNPSEYYFIFPDSIIFKKFADELNIKQYYVTNDTLLSKFYLLIRLAFNKNTIYIPYGDRNYYLILTKLFGNKIICNQASSIKQSFLITLLKIKPISCNHFVNEGESFIQLITNNRYSPKLIIPQKVRLSQLAFENICLIPNSYGGMKNTKSLTLDQFISITSRFSNIFVLGSNEDKKTCNPSINSLILASKNIVDMRGKMHVKYAVLHVVNSRCVNYVEHLN